MSFSKCFRVSAWDCVGLSFGTIIAKHVIVKEYKSIHLLKISLNYDVYFEGYVLFCLSD